MNQLSQLIYFAGVSQSLSSMFWVIFSAVGIVGGVGMIVWAITINDESEPHRGYDEKDEPKPWGWALRGGTYRQILKALVAIFVVSGLLASLLPSKDTVYAIAASEIGEDVLASPTASKAIKALDVWLDKQIASK